MENETLTTAEIDALAHERTAARVGWLAHAGVYLTANLALGIASILGGHHWAIYPFLGWGLGLLAHGAMVLGAIPSAGLYQRLLNRERLRLAPRRDPW
ncbi:MAG: 2TM domain-containing protein [Burkholderiaceae bacterium]